MAAVASAAPVADTGNAAKPRVYRLRRLPRDADPLQVIQILSASLDGVKAEDVQIGSLASAVDPWEELPTKTATLIFKRMPSALKGKNKKFELSIAVVGLPRTLILDRHFHGITPLNDVAAGRHKFECVRSPLLFQE